MVTLVTEASPQRATARPGLRRVTTRAQFRALREGGRRGRAGSITVTWRAGDGVGVAVAYAVGRSVGGAVVRNRLRRRLRAVLAALHAAGTLSPGTYLVAPTKAAVDLDPAGLTEQVTAAVRSATRSRR